jgi:hypothetical protein
MKRNSAIAIVTILMFLMLACNMSSLTASVPTVDPLLLVQQAQAETAAAQTQVGAFVLQTMAALFTPTTQPTYTIQPTYTLQFTYTPEFTFTPQSTNTPNFPRVTVSVDTNCRTGPGNPYDQVGALMVGQSAEVVGRSQYNDSWIIRLPNKPTVTCWLWGQYGTVTGDTSQLPIYQPPPTPTPSANFTVAFLDNTNCGSQYAFQFNIKNTGGTTWESIRIVVNDLTAGTTTTHTLDSFRSYESCPMESNQQSLDPGESAHVANINPGELSYDPSGNDFSATFKLCSNNGLTGLCLEKTITFHP